jgi:hypothetical protein
MMEVLAVPEPLVGISDLRLCPAGCVGGFRPDEFEPVEGSDTERVLGPECPTCGGTGIDPFCYEGCCETDDEHYGAVMSPGLGWQPYMSGSYLDANLCTPGLSEDEPQIAPEAGNLVTEPARDVPRESDGRLR